MFIKHCKIPFWAEFILWAYYVKELEEQNICRCDVGDYKLAEMFDEEPLERTHQDLGEKFQEEIGVLNHNEMDVVNDLCQEASFDCHYDEVASYLHDILFS